MDPGFGGGSRVTCAYQYSANTQSSNWLINNRSSDFYTHDNMPTAIVTGANSGIGEAFARILIKEVCIYVHTSAILTLQGYDVTAVDVNVGDKLQALQCAIAELDVTSPESILKFREGYGDKPVDLLLNIAG